MKTNYIIVAFGIVLLFVFLTICVQKITQDKLTTTEGSMMKSCSGGPSCFDNMQVGLLESVDGNQTEAGEIITSLQNRFFDIIKSEFGLEKSDYELSCTECYMWRGGYIKAKGIYKDGSPLELYYHWGWCSSAGTACGWDMCFNSSSNDVFKSVKNNFCNKIYSWNRGIFSTGEEYDNTEEVRERCFAGEFEKIDGNNKILSIKQISSGGKSYVEKGNFNCLAMGGYT